MKIGILEIMPQGHYTLVDSIARIYASDTHNQIFICTHDRGAEVLNPLINEKIGDIKLVVKDKNESLISFFEKVNQLNLNLLFIVTLEKYFDAFYNFNFNCNLSLFIHNIDAWFLINLRYKIYNFLSDFTFSARIIYKIKVSFIYSKWRKKIVNKLLNSHGRFVVLNKILKNELKEYVSQERIDVIPFSVFNKNLQDTSLYNHCLRICIPGAVSQLRRDYFSVLNLFEEEIEFYRGKVELDLLGCIIEYEQGRKIIEQAKRLISNGINVSYYNNSFIPTTEFDAQLCKADIILGNMNVTLNKYSKYGKTKDTGIIFTMIRAAKPGILPSDYVLIDELKSSSLIYDDYSKLNFIIKNLVDNKGALHLLKKEAQKNSLLFNPYYIYKNLSN